MLKMHFPISLLLTDYQKKNEPLTFTGQRLSNKLLILKHKQDIGVFLQV